MMDSKLKQILELALRPETGDGESAAALSAARRLVSKHGLGLLGAESSERVVYRDRVIYRNPVHSHTLELTLKFPATFHHSMIERIFTDAAKLGCDIQLLSCKTQAEAVMSGTVIKIKVLGSKSALQAYNSNIDSYIDQINNRAGSRRATPNPKGNNSKCESLHEEGSSSGLMGWLKKIFG